MQKAELDMLVIGNAADPRSTRLEDVQTALNSHKVKELRERSRAARRTPPPSGEDVLIRPDFLGSEMIDIGIPIGRASGYSAISARTPPDSELHTTSTAAATEAFTPSTHINDLEFTLHGINATDLDMKDFLNFGNSGDVWDLPLEQGAHGESGGFMGE